MPDRLLKVISAELPAYSIIVLGFIVVTVIDIEFLNSTSSKPVELIQINTGILAAAAVIQFLLTKLPSKDRVHDAEFLEHRATRLAKTLNGRIRIFNIELNTFDNHNLWKAFCTTKKVGEIEFVLSSNIFRRMERRLRAEFYDKQRLAGAHQEGRKYTLDVFSASKATLCFRVPVLSVDWERTAFALFVRQRKHWTYLKQTCLLFPKTAPLCSPRVPDADVGTGPAWAYRLFIESTNYEVVSECDNIMDHAAMGNRQCLFDKEDLLTLVEGKSQDWTHILTEHGINDHAIINRARQLTAQTAGAVTPHKSTVGSTVTVILDTPRASTFTDRRDPRLRITFMGIDPTKSKPLAIWAPPWNVNLKKWQEFTEQINTRLLDTFVVAHIEFANNPHQYTFSGAQYDLDDTLRFAAEHSAELGLTNQNWALLAVSVNSFLAAEVAAMHTQIDKLLLIMPGLDLFESLDNLLRNSLGELFTRRFYLAKPGVKASTPALKGGVNYFGTSRMSVYHLLDLCNRGGVRCTIDFLLENLGSFSARGGRIALGHSHYDSMTSWDSVAEIHRCLGLPNDSLIEVPWEHDIRSGVRYIPKVAGERPGAGPDVHVEALANWILHLNTTGG